MPARGGRTTEFSAGGVQVQKPSCSRPVPPTKFVHANTRSVLTHSPFSPSLLERCSLSPPKPTIHAPFSFVRARQSPWQPWQMDLPAIAFPQILGKMALRVHLITPVRVPHDGFHARSLPRHSVIGKGRNAVVQQAGNYPRLA